MKLIENNKIDIDKLNINAIENLSDLILESENAFTKQIAEICKTVCDKPNIKILLLAGPSASGKTTTSNLLKLNFEMLGKRVVTVSLDNFFLPREQTPKLPNGNYDFETINALDLNYLNQFISDLLIKKHAQMPIFNFAKGRAEDQKEEIVVDDHTIIIFEGLHALNPKLLKQSTNNILKLYIAPNSEYIYNNQVVTSAITVRLLRRITRDYYTRSYSAFNTIKMWQNVLDGEDKYIKPFKNQADFIINSIHAYEPLLYANYTKKLLNAELMQERKASELSENDLQALTTVKNLLNLLNNFEPIDKSLLPSTSLLWEFVYGAE